MAGIKPTIRKDGRKPFMLYLEPNLIKAVKRQALEKDVHAYELVEGLLQQHLGTDEPSSPNKPTRGA